MSPLATLRRLFARPPVREQTARCFCPGCDAELVAQRDAYRGKSARGVVRYVCGCGVVSRWLFAAPVPLLLCARSAEGLS